MVALSISNFGGMIPSLDDGLLPDNQAALSQNAWVYSGAIEGFCKMTAVHTLSNPAAKKAFRIPIEYFDKDHIPDSYWIEFDDPDVDVVSSPTVGDTFKRYYWAGGTVEPQYNTKDRIIAELPPFKLGVPAPAVAPTISITGGAGPNETRAYVYTWVTAYDEEGPPSPPTLGTGYGSGTWTIGVTAPTATVTAGRNIQSVRVYRTITASGGGTTYYFVAEFPIAATTYADTNLTSAVASNNVMASMFYEPPPDLKGIIAMPNGIVAGFREREVWFCEPYRPHAWPPPYAIAVESPIVGLGVTGQTLIVCTTGSPYAIFGTSPASMSQSRLAFSEPCLSRGSIVSTPVGVAYASPNGIVVAFSNQVEVITRNLITKDKWLDAHKFLSVPSLRAAMLNGGYYCWGSVLPGCFESSAFDQERFQLKDYTGAYRGAFIDFNNPRVAYTKLFSADPTYNCYADTWTGETLVVRGGQVFWLDIAPKRGKEPYIWRSKRFSTPNRRNLEALRVWFELLPDSPGVNPVRNTDSVQTLAGDQLGLVRVYADERLVMTREIRTDGELMRIPSGFKASKWQIEVEARVRIINIEAATTAKELLNV